MCLRSSPTIPLTLNPAPYIVYSSLIYSLFFSSGRWYSNLNIKASSQVTDVRVRCLIENKISENRKSAALEGITIEKFMEVASRILDKITVEGLYHGNCDEGGAKEVGNMIEDLLKKEGRGPLKTKPSESINKIPTGSGGGGGMGRLLVGSKNIKEPNNGVEHYYQISPDNTKERVIIDLLTQIMYEPLFDQVRTKEQFGYSVSCGARWTSGIMGVSMKIVTAVKTVKECSERLEKFVVDFRELLAQMKDEDYMSNVVSLAKIKLQVWNALSEQTSHFWSEITCCRYNYNCDLEEVKCLRGIKKADLLAFYDEYIVKGARGRRSVVVAVLGGESAGLGEGGAAGEKEREVSKDLEELDKQIAATHSNKKGGKWPTVYKHKH